MRTYSKINGNTVKVENECSDDFYFVDGKFYREDIFGKPNLGNEINVSDFDNVATTYDEEACKKVLENGETLCLYTEFIGDSVWDEFEEAIESHIGEGNSLYLSDSEGFSRGMITSCKTSEGKPNKLLFTAEELEIPEEERSFIIGEMYDKYWKLAGF